MLPATCISSQWARSSGSWLYTWRWRCWCRRACAPWSWGNNIMRQRKIIPGVDPKLLIKDAAKLMPDPALRGFLRGAASLGALAFLTGCDIIDGDTAEGVLRKISEFNDSAQAALFSSTKLAPTFPESAIKRPFPFNAYYDEDEAPEVDGNKYRLEIAGLVDNKKPWTLAELHALPEVSQITRHICVEGWSAIGSWQG